MIAHENVRARRAASALAAILAVTLGGAVLPARASICSVDPVPAATLLIPYFEVDTGCAAFGDANTRFTVTNTDAAPVLSRVQIWTNTGVPLFSFDIYLNGYDQQAVDLQDLLCDGTLPATGAGLPPGEGRFAEPPQNFPGCNGGTTPGASPVYSALPGDATALFRAALTGQVLPTVPGHCASIPNSRGTADGYITIDTVESCNAPNLTEAGFGNALSARNVLIGTAELIDDANNSSVSVPVVGLEASTALGNSASFYGVVGVNVGVRREPLPNAWSVESGRGAGLLNAQDFIVWRAPPVAGDSFVCGGAPTWYPLQIDNDSGYGSRGVFHVSDNGKARPTMRTDPMRLAAQRVGVTEAFPAAATMATGWTYMNLHRQIGGQSIPAQAWVGLVRRGAGRFETLTPGTPLDTSCNGTAFANISPGPAYTYAGEAMAPDRHVTLSANATNVTEGNVVSVTVSLGRPAEQNLDVAVEVTGAFAGQVDDNYPVATLLSGNTAVVLPITVTQDGVAEGSLQGQIRLSHISPAGNITMSLPSELNIQFTDDD